MAAAPVREFNHLRERSIGLPQALFQSITHTAPAAVIVWFATAGIEIRIVERAAPAPATGVA